MTVFSRGVLDPYSDVDPFDQGDIDFNMTSFVAIPSEEYMEQERVINEDSDDEYIAIYLDDDGDDGIDKECIISYIFLA